MIEGQTLFTIGGLLMTASLVAMAARRLNIPYSVGLVAAGALLALSPISVPITLTRDFIFFLILPPLLFNAALQLPWRIFWRNLGLSAALAGPGVALAACVVAIGLHVLLGWSWTGACLFGVLIAATDPVAVVAAMKEADADVRLRTVVESESLLNDGLAASLFALVLIFAGDPQATIVTGFKTFLWESAGGLLVGGLAGGLMLLIAGRTKDHLVEITLSSIAAFGSFLIADMLHMSGVLAVVAAGLVTANVGWTHAISERGRGAVDDFWQYAAFLANSIIFIILGVQEAREPLLGYWLPILVAYLLTLLARAVSTYPVMRLANWRREPLDRRSQGLLMWCGLRGAVALALALGVPDSVAEKPEIVVTAFGVVALSIFIQGLTVPLLIRRVSFKDAGHQS